MENKFNYGNKSSLQFVDQITDDLLCSKCKNIMTEAYAAPCACCYCLKCITAIINTHSSPVCVKNNDECKNEILVLRENVFRSIITIKKIEKLKVKCSNDGCNIILMLKDYEKHLNECQFGREKLLHQINDLKLKLNEEIKEKQEIENNLMMQLNKEKKETHNIQKQLFAEKKEKVDIQNQLDKVNSEMEEIQRQLITEKKVKLDLQEHIVMEDIVKEDIREQLDKEKKKVNDIQKQLLKKKKGIVYIHKQLINEKSKMEKIQKQLVKKNEKADIQEQFDKEKKKMEEIQKEKTDIQEQLDKEKKKMEEIQKHFVAEKKERTDIQEQLDKEKKKMEEIQKQYIAENTDIQEQLDKEKNKIEELQKQLLVEKNEKADVQEQLQNKIEELEDIIKKLVALFKVDSSIDQTDEISETEEEENESDETSESEEETEFIWTVQNGKEKMHEAQFNNYKRCGISSQTFYIKDYNVSLKLFLNSEDDLVELRFNTNDGFRDDELEWPCRLDFYVEVIGLGEVGVFKYDGKNGGRNKRRWSENIKLCSFKKFKRIVYKRDFELRFYCNE